MPVRRRKPIRLSPHLYGEEGRLFSVTICTARRETVFGDLDFGFDCVTQLEELSRSCDIAVLAYCLMPDHVHLLLSIGEGSSLPQFVGAWKSKCYLARRRRGSPKKFWQRSFYDHALREEEDVRQLARYILENPVRRGMVSDYREYPLCGSFELDLGGGKPHPYDPHRPTDP